MMNHHNNWIHVGNDECILDLPPLIASKAPQILLSMQS